MFGLMMDPPLTIQEILRHALKFHARSQIVSRLGDRRIHRYTYADFGARVHQLANALKQLGIEPGDRVGTLAWNSYRHLELFYAISCIGAVCHTINPRLFPQQIEYIINHAQDKVLFVETDFLATVEAIAPRLQSVDSFVALCEPDEVPAATFPVLHSYERLLADKKPCFDWPQLDERTASSLCYTSGTTGQPKGVLYTHRTTLLHAMTGSGGDWLNIRARDCILPAVPMFHANAWGLPYAALMNGAQLVLPGHAVDGESLTQLIEAEAVTLMAGVPTVWLELLGHLRASRKKLDTVERVMVGGAAAPPAMVRSFEEEHDVSVVHGWGMTELSPIGTLGSLKRGQVGLPPDERYRIQCLQGRPVFGVDIRIVDGDGTILPHDGRSVGVLEVRAFWGASSYYRGDAAEQFTPDGWFSTGDLAAIDADGFLRITDRTKDVIKSGGEWISSIDLENIAMSHPDIAEVACIAVPDAKWGERPILCVVPRHGASLDPQSVLSLYRDRVSRWWVPDHVEVVGSLPHGPTGKISKLTLRETYSKFQLPGARQDAIRSPKPAPNTR